MGLEALEELMQGAPPGVNRPSDFVPTFLEISYGYRPGGSSGLSVVLHALAVFFLLYASTRLPYVHAAEVVPQKLQPLKIDPLYLPTLGGGSEGSGQQGGGSGAPTEASSGLLARSNRGFAYPGRQPLVSAPPMAEIGIQTILQPNLVNPPQLHKDFPLPNLAIAAQPPAPEPPKPVMKIKSGRLAIRPIEPAVRAPKLNLPAASASAMPTLASAEPAMPQAPPPKPIPVPARTSEMPTSTRDKEGLLVLNAIPPPPDTLAKVPFGEARSLFVLAPGAATIIADPAAGAVHGSGAKASGNGVPSDNPSGDAIADVPSGAGKGVDTGASGTGSGSKYGSVTGRGVNTLAGSTGTEQGADVGTGTGLGSSNVMGSGAGKGNSPGGGGFPGISIRGGNYGNGTASIHTNVIPRKQTSYSMTITSTAASGGGLPDFGVFQNQKIYTVYLDMRDSDEDTTPSWILQYAPLQPNEPMAVRVPGVPTPPYATLKQVPELTPELALTCAHKLIVVSGVLNTNGRLEQLVVRKSPDPRVQTLVTDALSNWMFQPSQIQGSPVPLKVMLGIRLTSQ